MPKRARPETCVVCCESFAASEGTKCSTGHFTHISCLDTLCQQALERDPVGVTEAEKTERCYQVACCDPSGCGRTFGIQALACTLSPERFAQYCKRNVELALHLALPDAVKEHLAAVAASGQSTKEEHEKCIRDAYLRTDGSFRTEDGQHVRQCSECGYGPIIAKVNCGDMNTHHGDILGARGQYIQNNGCLHCGHIDPRHYSEWPRWTGELVLGAEPSPAPAVTVPARPSVARRAVRAAATPAQAAPTASFRVGDRVRVRQGVERPAYQWGAVRRTSEGTVTRIYGERCDVDFPEQLGWMGRVDEMERVEVGSPRGATSSAGTDGVATGGATETSPTEATADSRPLVEGDRVRVRATVREPRHGWGSVRRGDVGTIRSVSLASGPSCGITVDFPRQSSWAGLRGELERADEAVDLTAGELEPNITYPDDFEATLQAMGEALGEGQFVDDLAPAVDAPIDEVARLGDGDEDGEVDDEGLSCLGKIFDMGFETEPALLALRHTAHLSGEVRVQATIDILVAS